MQFVMMCLITATCIMKVYTMNFTNYLVVLYCKFPYDDVAAASLMYSTYIHCLYVYTV